MALVLPSILTAGLSWEVLEKQRELDKRQGIRELPSSFGQTYTIETAGIMKSMKRHKGSSAILERLLEPVSRSLNIEAARQLIKVKADSKTQARIDVLAQKCNEGDLTPTEKTEYERYVTAGTLIAILQARARFILSKNS